jgi:hypothetical protein
MDNIWSIGNMRIEFQIIQELKNAMHQLIPAKGLKFKFDLKGGTRDFDYPEAIISVNFEDLSFKLIIEVSVHNSLPIFTEKISRLKSLYRHNNMVPVILARYLSPQRQELCHNEGVCFIDLSGNVYFMSNGWVSVTNFPKKEMVEIHFLTRHLLFFGLC